MTGLRLPNDPVTEMKSGMNISWTTAHSHNESATPAIATACSVGHKIHSHNNHRFT